MGSFNQGYFKTCAFKVVGGGQAVDAGANYDNVLIVRCSTCFSVKGNILPKHNSARSTGELKSLKTVDNSFQRCKAWSAGLIDTL
jgi:hypothetical protein